MLYPSNNKLLEYVDSKYSLVTIVSKRARQILDGAEPLIRIKSAERAISIAVREVAEGKIGYHRIEREEQEEEQLDSEV